MKIWCLFSVENNYDQPRNNLVAWWLKKPSGDTLFKVIEPNASQRFMAEKLIMVTIVELLAGSTSRYDNADFRLEHISEGVVK